MAGLVLVAADTPSSGSLLRPIFDKVGHKNQGSAYRCETLPCFSPRAFLHSRAPGLAAASASRTISSTANRTLSSIPLEPSRPIA
jgi:hypothetical protein